MPRIRFAATMLLASAPALSQPLPQAPASAAPGANHPPHRIQRHIRLEDTRLHAAGRSGQDLGAHEVATPQELRELRREARAERMKRHKHRRDE